MAGPDTTIRRRRHAEPGPQNPGRLAHRQAAHHAERKLSNHMKIEGSVALVTGANRGLGRHFAQQLLARGAAKVYAAARHPDSVNLDGVVPVRVDLTDQTSIEAAAELASDITLLINNAGV